MKRSRAITLRRGASIAEYALLLVAVLLVGAGAMKLLGGSLSRGSGRAGAEVSSGEGSGGGGGAAGGKAGGAAAAGGGGGGGGGGGAAGGGKAASKASLGGGMGSDGVSGGAAGGGGKSAAGGAGGGQGGAAEKSDGVVASIAEGDWESPHLKKIMAICFLGAGAAALGYYGYRARKALKEKPESDAA